MSCAQCVSTVFVLTCSRNAISFVDRPSAGACMTCRWRGVRLASGAVPPQT